MRHKSKDISSFETRKPLKTHHKFLIAGAVITGLSFVVTSVPCTIIDSNSTYPGFCKLPNPLASLETTSHYYYGFSNNPISGLILQFALAILISYLVVYLFKKLNIKRKNYKIIDLTKK